MCGARDWSRTLVVVLVAIVGLAVPSVSTAQDASATTGILLLAHGGSSAWNQSVTAVADTVGKTQPVEVAFGMATRASMQAGIDRLIARGVTRIVAVPLFVSSHSSVITSIEFLLGQRAVAPPELEMFAGMDHGAPSAAADPHAQHGARPAPAVPGSTPVTSRVPIRMVSALNDHPVVADILLARAMEISADPARETIVIVAHGPMDDDENREWLAAMKTLADRMVREPRFRRIDYLTVRDDADEPVRAAATADLRAVVTRARDEGSRVLIVPLLLSYGGIEDGIRKRLDGLDYVMARRALMPDDRLATWVIDSAK